MLGQIDNHKICIKKFDMINLYLYTIENILFQFNKKLFFECYIIHKKNVNILFKTKILKK